MSLARRFRIWAALGALLILVASPDRVLAEPQAEPAASASGEDLEARLAAIAELERRVGTASGEERRVLEERARARRLELLEDVHAFAREVLAAERAGEAAAGQRELAQRGLEVVSRELERRGRVLVAEADALRQQRDAAPPEEQAELARQLVDAEDRIQQAAMLLREHAGLASELGLETADARERLGAYLSERAETLGSRVELLRRDRQRLREQAENRPEDGELAARLQALEERVSDELRWLAATADEMEALGLDSTEQRQLLIEATGRITTDLLDTQVALGLLQRWGRGLVDRLVESGPTLLFRSALFVGILLAFQLLAGFTRRMVERAVSSARVNLSQLLRETLVAWVGRAVLLLGLLIGLSQLGFQLGPLLAGLGIAGFIVGFALQDTLANFAAGAMILIYRPYDVGDVIEAAGILGKVRNMSLVSTTILTFDNQTLIVPNSKIWGDVIKNVTAQDVRRVDLVFGVSYADDVEHVKAVLHDVVSKHEQVLREPEPVVRLHELAESSLNFVVRPWVRTADYWDVYWDLTEEVKRRFDAEGIQIPFPQRDVHLTRDTD